ncbi:hypothetical protein BDW62DRAFT_178216 [Aspergillus aurantiobrunneus]
MQAINRAGMGLEVLLSRKMDRYTEPKETTREAAVRTVKRERMSCSQPADGCTGQLINHGQTLAALSGSLWYLSLAVAPCSFFFALFDSPVLKYLGWSRLS